MSKILVDTMPTGSKDCPFAEYIQMTSKYKCTFRSGLYSRCFLDCGDKCGYLVSFEEIIESEN